MEVATEWLFSVPQHVLETHLAGEPGTPQEEVGAVHDDERVLSGRVCVSWLLAAGTRWL